MYRKLIFESVASSSAIDSIRTPFKQLAGSKHVSTILRYIPPRVLFSVPSSP